MVKTKCTTCAKKLSVHPYRLKASKHFFCDHSCYGDWRSKNIRKENHPMWKGDHKTLNCAYCKKDFTRPPCHVRRSKFSYCSKKCSDVGRGLFYFGKLAPAWRGGIVKGPRGYILEAAPGHPSSMRNSYVPQHRLVMEKHLGRYLTDIETVHHKNGVRHDNRIENLELWAKNHGAGQRVEDLVAFVIKHYRPEVEKALQ